MAGRQRNYPARGYPRPNHYVTHYPANYPRHNNSHSPSDYHPHPHVARSANRYYPHPHRSRQLPPSQAPDLLDKMFASASASLTALCLSVRAIEGRGNGPNSGVNLEHAKNAASSQAAACLEWIKAISSTSSTDAAITQDNNNNRNGLLLTLDRASCADDEERVQANESTLQSPSDQEKDLIVVEQTTSRFAAIDSKIESRFSLVEKPLEKDLEIIDPCHKPLEKDLAIIDPCHKPVEMDLELIDPCEKSTSAWFDAPHAKNSTSTSGASASRLKGTSRTNVSPIVYTLAKALCTSASTNKPSLMPHIDKHANKTFKQPHLKDSDFLFDADFEAFLP